MPRCFARYSRVARVMPSCRAAAAMLPALRRSAAAIHSCSAPPRVWPGVRLTWDEEDCVPPTKRPLHPRSRSGERQYALAQLLTAPEQLVHIDQLAVVDHDHRSLDQVLQLPDIAGETRS